MSGEGKNLIEVAKQAREVLDKHPKVVREIPGGTTLYRCQKSKHDREPRNYGHTNSRYTPADTEEGVLYVGFSPEVALAESFQPGQGGDSQALSLSDLQAQSLHRMESSRPLRVVDAVALANRAGYHKLRDLVQAKGQGSEGYVLSQEFARICMEREDIDGILYPSAVYGETGTYDGCNLALFEGRGTQVKPLDYQPVITVELESGEFAVEFLDSLGVALVTE